PLSFFGGIGAASKQGILVKGSNYLEALNKVDTVAFDKTGTLTRGKFAVVKVAPVSGITKDQLLQMAASVEKNSTHPIASSIQSAYTGKILPIENATESAGHGLTAEVDDQRVIVGNAKSMRESGVNFVESTAVGTIVYV